MKTFKHLNLKHSNKMSIKKGIILAGGSGKRYIH